MHCFKFIPPEGVRTNDFGINKERSTCLIISKTKQKEFEEDLLNISTGFVSLFNQLWDVSTDYLHIFNHFQHGQKLTMILIL